MPLLQYKLILLSYSLSFVAVGLINLILLRNQILSMKDHVAQLALPVELQKNYFKAYAGGLDRESVHYFQLLDEMNVYEVPPQNLTAIF